MILKCKRLKNLINGRFYQWCCFSFRVEYLVNHDFPKISIC